MRRRGLSNVAALSLRLPIAIALAATLAVIAHDAASSAPPTRAGATAERPNVLVVLTDDQTVGELSERSMPVVMRKLAAPGAEFTNSFVSSPLCCPSRAGDLTGEYPHNSGVYDNEPGYPSLNNKTSTVYGWMQAAGDLTDDDSLKNEGKVDQAAGTVKDKVGDAADKAKDVVNPDDD